jgi:ABC-type uncharacterized transport system permease subunit
MVNVGVSIIIFIIGILMHDQSISALQWIGWFVGLICGSIILFSLETIVGNMSFFFVNASGVQSIFYALYQIAMRPDGIYNSAMRRIFITIFPLSLIASVPSSMLFNTASVEMFIIMVIVTIIMSITSVRFFSFALKRYNGASS